VPDRDHHQEDPESNGQAFARMPLLSTRLTFPGIGEELFVTRAREQDS